MNLPGDTDVESARFGLELVVVGESAGSVVGLGSEGAKIALRRRLGCHARCCLITEQDILRIFRVVEPAPAGSCIKGAEQSVCVQLADGEIPHEAYRSLRVNRKEEQVCHCEYHRYESGLHRQPDNPIDGDTSTIGPAPKATAPA